MAISSDLERLLSAWLPRQGWFPKLEADLSADPDITPMSVTRLFEYESGRGSAGRAPGSDGEGDVAAGTIRGIQAIASVGAGRTLRRLSIPLSFRTEEVFELRPHLVGTVDDITLGRCYVYDGCADPVFVLSYAHAMSGGMRFDGDQVRATAVRSGDDATGAAPFAAPFAELGSQASLLERAGRIRLGIVDSRSTESSVVVDDPATPCVITFFRVLQPGLSSAVRIPVALTEAGSAAVPEVYGWAAGRWFDAEDLTTSTAPLAMLSRNHPGTRPAWREAVDIACAVDSGTISSYNKKARALGARVGELHLDLAAEFGVVSSMGAPAAEWVGKWQDRVDWALARAPLALGSLGQKLRAHKESLTELTALGGLQRIHGELTLDQVVTSDAAGFQVVNFSEATQEFPKPPAVDLVALMRSIDYAAGFARLRRTGALDIDAQPVGLGLSGLEESGESLQEVVDSPEHLWSSQAQNLLLTGYSHAVNASVGLHDPVLRAVLIDRLLVEVVTELRNRPTWLIVPLATLSLLLGGRLGHDVPVSDPEAAARAWEPAPAASVVSAEEFSQAAAAGEPEAFAEEDAAASEAAEEDAGASEPGVQDSGDSVSASEAADVVDQPAPEPEDSSLDLTAEATAAPAADAVAPVADEDLADADLADADLADADLADADVDGLDDADDAEIDESAELEQPSGPPAPPLPARPAAPPRFPPLP